MLLHQPLGDRDAPGSLFRSPAGQCRSLSFNGHVGDDLRRLPSSRGRHPPGPGHRPQLLERLAGPALAQRAPGNGPDFSYFARASGNDMRPCTPAAAQPSASLPSGAEAAVRLRRLQLVVHGLAELVAVLPARLAEEALERRTAVVADQVLGQQLGSVLHQPEHEGVVHGHLPLDPGLKRQHEGPDQPFQLLDSVLNTPIALGLISRRSLRKGL